MALAELEKVTKAWPPVSRAARVPHANSRELVLLLDRVTDEVGEQPNKHRCCSLCRSAINPAHQNGPDQGRARSQHRTRLALLGERAQYHRQHVVGRRGERKRITPLFSSPPLFWRR
jgi:hypothetical protein